MTRNLKVLGLALVAVLVLGAWGASLASAHTPARFTAPETSTTTGNEIVSNILKVTGLETSCQVVSLHGRTPDAVSYETQTITPSYTECIAESIFGTINVTVTGFAAGTGCNWVFGADGRVDLECAAGKEVTIDAATCTIHIPPQTDLGTVTYATGTRPSGKHDLISRPTISGITTNHTDGFGCPLPSGGESATSTLVGTTTTWAEDKDGVDVDLTWHATVA